MQFDLAIVIVNYNTRELLCDCLNSIFDSPGGFAYLARLVVLVPLRFRLSGRAFTIIMGGGVMEPKSRQFTVYRLHVLQGD